MGYEKMIILLIKKLLSHKGRDAINTLDTWEIFSANAHSVVISRMVLAYCSKKEDKKRSK